jgi:hypothetical protein
MKAKKREEEEGGGSARGVQILNFSLSLFALGCPHFGTAWSSVDTTTRHGPSSQTGRAP